MNQKLCRVARRVIRGQIAPADMATTYTEVRTMKFVNTGLNEKGQQTRRIVEMITKRLSPTCYRYRVKELKKAIKRDKKAIV